MYKVFVRPHQDYGDISDDEAYKENFSRNLNTIPA